MKTRIDRMVEQPNKESFEAWDDMEHQELEWKIERVGRFALLGALIAAALGLFGGGGPFARASAVDPAASLEVDYPRFSRYQSAERLEVRLGDRGGKDDLVRLAISRAYLGMMEVKSVLPEPEKVEVSEEYHTFVFAAPRTERRFTIVFNLAPEKFGVAHGVVRVEERGQVGFRQVVYP